MSNRVQLRGYLDGSALYPVICLIVENAAWPCIERGSRHECVPIGCMPNRDTQRG